MAVKILNLTDFAKYRFGFAVSSHENSLKVTKWGYMQIFAPKYQLLNHSNKGVYARVAQW